MIVAAPIAPVGGGGRPTFSPGAAVSSPLASLSFCLRPVNQLQPRAISWLWPGRLALGKLALLEGDPGLGSRW